MTPTLSKISLPSRNSILRADEIQNLNEARFDREIK